MSLGAKIRSRRQLLGLTLDTVAQAAELSKPFLSQVERNHATPSLSSLHRIAEALQVNTEYFVTVPTEKETVKRGDKLRFFTLENSPKTYASLTGNVPNRQLEALMVRMPPQAEMEVSSHAGEEFFYMLEGVLCITVDGQEFELRAGDSAHYLSTAPHLWENRGAEDVVLIWVGTPTLFDL